MSARGVARSFRERIDGVARALSAAWRMLGRRAVALRAGLGILMLDASLILLAGLLFTYTWTWFAWGSERAVYLVMPWWAVFALSLELAAIWQSFAISIGHSLLGVRLLGRDRRPPTLRQRLTHFAMWHVSALPLLGLFVKPAAHERAAGLSLQPHIRLGTEPNAWHKRSVTWFCVVVGAIALAAAIGASLSWDSVNRLFSDAWRVAPIWRALVRPSLNVVRDSLSDLVVTLFMAIMATAFAAVLAIPLSFFAARNLSRGPGSRLVYTFVRGLMSILRSIEPIVWAIVFLVWVTSRYASFAGTLALWVTSVADLTKLYAERLEAIDEGVIEAISATGANRLQVMRHAVVPQIVNPYISFTLYRFDINIRMATVVGLIGAGGIGYRLLTSLTAQRYSEAGTIMLLIVVAVWAIDYLSARFRQRLN